MKDRENLLLIFRAGLEAVAPDSALLTHLTVEKNSLSAGGKTFKIPDRGIRVIGAGKGSAPMALAFENLLGNRILQGFVVVKYGHELDLGHFEIAQAAHPVPDKAGENAADKCLEIAGKCGPDDLLVCLFTGGASALLPAPVKGLTLEDMRETTTVLLECGAEIGEINAIRRHLSRIGGGGIVRAAHGAHILSLIVSDVIGDNLQDIASGPTARENTSFSDCLNIIKKYNIASRLPKAALIHIEKGARTQNYNRDSELFENVENVIIASNRQAMEAAAREAARLGFGVAQENRPLEGEARLAAKYLIDKAKKIKADISGKPVCLIAGGETTVTIRGRGKGGRNQEMALAAALELENFSGISALFAGTDGTDGPVDAAGGFAFSNSVQEMGGRKNAESMLADNDSHAALQKSGDLLITGPTRTNVMDLAIIIIRP